MENRADVPGSSPSESIIVKQVGTRVWILRALGPLEGEAVSALRDAFREVLARGATDVVVDLGATSIISSVGARAVASMSDSMRSLSGALWMAAAWQEEDGYTLRPIQGPAPAAFLGISPALDRALLGDYDVDNDMNGDGLVSEAAVGGRKQR